MSTEIPSGDAGPRPGEAAGRLREALGRRQMAMIAIGGVIGAGLFVGSGSALHQAGPAVLVAYAGIGVVVVLVMRMLAELAVAQPETGSFSSYAGRELGPWAGLSVGWLYAYHWCVTIAFEAIAGAVIIHDWLPGVPTWLAALVVIASLVGVNLTRVESYGGFEFWFAMVKVAAITVFLLFGVLAVVGLFPGTGAPGVSNLTGHGGFAPQGWSAVLQASLVVFFSFFGTEAITIAAGEAKNPAQAVRAGVRSVVWRILLFYIGSIAVVVMLMPWGAKSVQDGPFVAVLEHLDIPGAGSTMKVVVLTAVLSCLNSGVYSSSRMIYSLADRGDAPALLRRTAGNGVPVPAVLTTSSIGLAAVVANYFLPTGSVFDFLLKSSGSIAVVIYLSITVTHLRARARLEREAPASLTVRMWAYPYLSVLVLCVLLAIIGGMAVTSANRRTLVLTTTVTVVAVAAGLIRQRATRTGEAVAAAGPAPESG